MNVVQGKIRPIHDNILVVEMSFDEQKTSSGIILRSDDGKTEGIRPRWAKIWAIGPEQDHVKVGEWALVEHGRWTRGVTVKDETGAEIVIRRVDPNAVLALADEKPADIEIGESYSNDSPMTIRPEDFMR